MIIEAWPHTNLVSITALSSWWHAVIHWVHRPPWSVTMLKSGLYACAWVVMVRVTVPAWGAFRGSVYAQVRHVGDQIGQRADMMQW